MSEAEPINEPLHGLPPMDKAGFDLLVELALDVRRSWNHPANGGWRAFDPELWEFTRTPRTDEEIGHESR